MGHSQGWKMLRNLNAVLVFDVIVTLLRKFCNNV